MSNNQKFRHWSSKRHNRCKFFFIKFIDLDDERQGIEVHISISYNNYDPRLKVNYYFLIFHQSKINN